MTVNPPQVTYRYNPEFDNPAYGLRHDRAYWISGLTTVHKGYGDVDLTTQGCGGNLPVTTATSGAGSDPVPWVSQGAEIVRSTPLVQAPRLSGSLSNIATITIDVGATCLNRVGIHYDVTTDGPALIRFSDGRSIPVTGAGRHIGTLR
ncbi:hypothetical protein AB0M80_31150 [Amycolatopsis sp. NPDC051045]|uniref:hypothetical protein n=1 Tax=Amycolatopsis sp. NPDC051045 TaxID=3156922 RepID=UPI003442399D